MSVQPWRPDDEWDKEVATLLPRALPVQIYRSDNQPKAGKFIALYSEPGVGKTTLASQTADCIHTAPLLYINVAGGAWVFSHRNDITIADIHKWEDFTTLSMRLFQARTMPFKAILIDHGTALQAFNVLSVMGTSPTSPGGINGKGTPSQPQWGVSTAQMLNAFRGYHELTRKFGTTVVVSVQQDARKDSVTNQIVKAGIGFTPALARAFPYMADVVGHLSVKDDPPAYTRVLSFAKTAHSDAKLRRNKTEVANSIPLVIAYQDQPVLVDVLNALIGGTPWPVAKYAKLQSKAKVEYATVIQTNEGDGVVGDQVATLVSQSESGDTQSNSEANNTKEGTP